MACRFAAGLLALALFAFGPGPASAQARNDIVPDAWQGDILRPKPDMHGLAKLRFITDSDELSRRRVVVLGEQMRKDLKLPDDPSGRFVQIGNEWYKVVGALEVRGEAVEWDLHGAPRGAPRPAGAAPCCPPGDRARR